jgi:phosphoglycolate phosphatase-like HAD superfamily hydrolase
VVAVVRRLVLWDVDGTLIRAGDIGAAVFDSAIEAVLGVHPGQRIQMSGKTDPQIVAEYLDQLEIAEADGMIDAVLARAARDLADAAAAGVLTREGYACPGVGDLLEAIAGEPDVISSLLTGNILPNAITKVSAFGLDRWLRIGLGAYGSDHRDRNQLVPIALGRVEEELGLRVDPTDVWVVGDTPRDCECALAAGVRCLLVGTGRFTASELATLGADAVLDDLADTRAVLKLLLSEE